jgi:hypothetical protein
LVSNASLGLDGHGKSLSFRLLELPIQIAAVAAEPTTGEGERP